MVVLIAGGCLIGASCSNGDRVDLDGVDRSDELEVGTIAFGLNVGGGSPRVNRADFLKSMQK